MAVHAHKRKDESNDALQNRFKRQMQNTGLMKLLRRRSVRVKKPNRRMMRMTALSREKNRANNKKNMFYSSM